MEALNNRIMDQLESRYALEPLPIDEDLREIKLPLGYMKMNLYNWSMEKVRKVNVMRTSVKMPNLEVYAIEIYPEDDYDLPLLAIDFSKMKKKTFVYLNFIPLFTDADYRKKYLDRLGPIRDKYTIVPEVKAKDWMQPYLHQHSVYAMPKNALLPDAYDCAFEYLSCYLDMLDGAEKVRDSNYGQKVRAASLAYCDELTEKDGSRQMLGRFIGMNRANRIFQEVIR
jgi:hypothetical protein